MSMISPPEFTLPKISNSLISKNQKSINKRQNKLKRKRMSEVQGPSQSLQILLPLVQPLRGISQRLVTKILTKKL